jgi:hypothetical protein
VDEEGPRDGEEDMDEANEENEEGVIDLAMEEDEGPREEGEEEAKGEEEEEEEGKEEEGGEDGPSGGGDNKRGRDVDDSVEPLEKRMRAMTEEAIVTVRCFGYWLE